MWPCHSAVNAVSIYLIETELYGGSLIVPYRLLWLRVIGLLILPSSLRVKKTYMVEE